MEYRFCYFRLEDVWKQLIIFYYFILEKEVIEIDMEKKNCIRFNVILLGQERDECLMLVLEYVNVINYIFRKSKLLVVFYGKYYVDVL